MYNSNKNNVILDFIKVSLKALMFPKHNKEIKDDYLRFVKNQDSSEIIRKKTKMLKKPFHYSINYSSIYSNFKNEKTSYHLEILNKENKDFQLIKKSFYNTANACNSNVFSSYFKIKRICRVHQDYPSRKPEDIESEKILVFHGTPRKNVTGILREGFIPSKACHFGPGVYHSNFFSLCRIYANKDSRDDSYFYFINEIPMKYVSEKHFIKDMNYSRFNKLPEFYCDKYVSDEDQKEQYAYDSDGSLINVSEDQPYHVPQYVSSSNITIPKYLVHARYVEQQLVNALFNISF